MLTETGKRNADRIMQEAIKEGITDPKELANFMAQMQHESGGFQKFEENLHYSPERLLEKFSGRNGLKSLEQARKITDDGPETVGNAIYGGYWGKYGDGHGSLRNTEPGDGYKYRGRGIIQLTGRDNYEHIGKELGIDLVNHPELASEPEIATKIAITHWKSEVRSENAQQDVEQTTKIINGGTNGLTERREYAHEWETRLKMGYKPGMPDPLATLKASSSPEQIKQAQQELHDLGAKEVRANGVLDGATKQAVREFQIKHHLAPADGVMGAQTLTTLYDEDEKWHKNHHEAERSALVSDMTSRQDMKAPEHPSQHSTAIRPVSATPEETHKSMLREAPAVSHHEGTHEHQGEHQAAHEYPHKSAALLLKEGSQGDYVLAAQLKLRKLDYTGPHGATLSLDGRFGPATEHAVREFQKANGLSHDGIIGAHTGQALDQAYRKLPQQVVTPENTKEATQSVTTENKAAQAPEPEKKYLTIEEMKQKYIRIGEEAIARKARERQEQGLTETQDYTQSRGRGMRMR